MKRGLAFGLLCACLGCGGPRLVSLDGALDSGDADAPSTDGDAGDAPGDLSSEVSGDPALCGCNVDSEGTLSLDWDCYCAQPFAACDAALALPASCGAQTRKDYPSCGLTVVIAFTAAGVEAPSVYDASGKLVGRVAHSDLSGYLCPSDPSVVSATERAGQFPDASCQAVTCGSCYAGPFPCGSPSDGGSDGADPDAAPSDGALDVAGSDSTP
jgi:hypothetical protein